MRTLKATVASVRFSAPMGTFTYVTRMGWETPHLGKWAHGHAHRIGRAVDEVHPELLAAAAADALEKHGLDIEIVNPGEALAAARKAEVVAAEHGLRSAEAECAEEEGREETR